MYVGGGRLHGQPSVKISCQEGNESPYIDWLSTSKMFAIYIKMRQMSTSEKGPMAITYPIIILGVAPIEWLMKKTY